MVADVVPLRDPLLVDPSDIDDTSERLVTAAAQVFAERGYDGAGVQEIARRAGLTTGAIYSRFSGKAELLAEAIRTFTSDEFDQLFAQHRFAGRVTDLLATVGSHLVTREPSPAQAILLEAFVAARRDPEVAVVLREHLAERARGCRRWSTSRRPPAWSTPRSTPTPWSTSPTRSGSASCCSRRWAAENPAVEPWDGVITRLVSSLGPDPAHPPRPRHRPRRNHHDHHRPHPTLGAIPWHPTRTSSAEPTSTTSRRSSPSPTPTCTEAIHTVKDNADAIFTWDYEKGARPALNKLYEKAKTSQWNGETDLDWSIDVDPETDHQPTSRARTRRGRSSGWPSTPTRRSRTSATRSGPSSASRASTGASASSCTASRAR